MLLIKPYGINLTNFTFINIDLDLIPLGLQEKPNCF